MGEVLLMGRTWAHVKKTGLGWGGVRGVASTGCRVAPNIEH